MLSAKPQGSPCKRETRGKIGRLDGLGGWNKGSLDAALCDDGWRSCSLATQLTDGVGNGSPRRRLAGASRVAQGSGFTSGGQSVDEAGAVNRGTCTRKGALPFWAIDDRPPVSRGKRANRQGRICSRCLLPASSCLFPCCLRSTFRSFLIKNSSEICLQ